MRALLECVMGRSTHIILNDVKKPFVILSNERYFVIYNIILIKNRNNKINFTLWISRSVCQRISSLFLYPHISPAPLIVFYLPYCACNSARLNKQDIVCTPMLLARVL